MLNIIESEKEVFEEVFWKLIFNAITKDSLSPIFDSLKYFLVTNSVLVYEVCSKILGLFELRGSSWFQENPLGVARFVQIG